jgi:hypothetical protein
MGGLVVQSVRATKIVVMPGLVPGIHVLSTFNKKKDVDGRVKTGHDDSEQARR